MKERKWNEGKGHEEKEEERKKKKENKKRFLARVLFRLSFFDGEQVQKKGKKK